LMQWQSPVSLGIEEKPSLDYEICSHRRPYVLYQQQKAAFRGDSDISADVGKLKGAGSAVGNGLLFRGVTWKWIDALTQQYLRDGSTANPAYASNEPVYLLDNSTWIIYAAEGYFQNESEPIRSDDNHNVFNMHMDTIYQRVCVNP